MINRKILSFILIALMATTSFAGKVETVIVEGLGVSIESARENAAKNALGQVVGMYTVSDSVVKNRKLIKDEVLSYSNGFISKYLQLSSREESGLYIVEAKISVEIGKLTQALGKLNIALKNVSNTGFKLRAKQDFSSIKDFKKMFDKIVIEPVLNSSAYSLSVNSIDPYEEEVNRRKKVKYRFKNRSGQKKAYENGDLMPYIIKFKSSLNKEYFKSVAEFYEKSSIKTSSINGLSKCSHKKRYSCLAVLKPKGMSKYSDFKSAKVVGYQFSAKNTRVIQSKLKKIKKEKEFSLRFKLKDVNNNEIGSIIIGDRYMMPSLHGHGRKKTDYSSSGVLYYQGKDYRDRALSDRASALISGGLDVRHMNLSLMNSEELAVVVLLSESDVSQINQIELSTNWADRQ